MHFEIISIGILMGIAFAAPPGAITAETFRRGARGGFAPALGVQMGSLIGDATYALMALAGLGAIVQNQTLQIGLGAFGALFLMYLAWSSFRSNLEGFDLPDVVSKRGAFITGVVISLTNPWAIAFWLSLGGALASWGVMNADPREIGLFFASFMLGSVLWAFALAMIVTRLRAWMRPRVFRFVSIVCGIALGVFSIFSAVQVLSIIFGWLK